MNIQTKSFMHIKSLTHFTNPLKNINIKKNFHKNLNQSKIQKSFYNSLFVSYPPLTSLPFKKPFNHLHSIPNCTFSPLSSFFHRRSFVYCMKRALSTSHPSKILKTESENRSSNQETNFKKLREIIMTDQKPRILSVEPENVTLSQKEEDICELLRQVVSTFKLNTVMRIAGGWVRDKLLGESSHDIDICLDNMMGKEFANYVNSYLKEKGSKTHGIGVIKVNPEKSKHLETATVNISGQWVDFVNLRSETYESDSRIPEKIEFGTPLQDALRRDITINSLFYNINEKKVEDFTERGVDHLRKGVIETPLEPFITFTDDPLRCLRVIRFASRFNFTISETTYLALKNQEIHEKILKKVSRERIGTETEKMMKNGNASISLYIIRDTGIYDLIFLPYAPSSELISNASDTGVKAIQCFNWVLDNFKDLELSEDDFRLINISCAISAYIDCTYIDEKKKVQPQSNFIVSDSLRMSLKDTKSIRTIMEHSKKFKHLNVDFTRKEAGLILRESGSLWITSLVFALCLELSFEVKTIERRVQAQIVKAESICEKYIQIKNRIMDMNLQNCWEIKPLLNGKEIANFLGINPGPSIGVLTQSLVEWQLENPELDVEEAKKWLQNQHNV